MNTPTTFDSTARAPRGARGPAGLAVAAVLAAFLAVLPALAVLLFPRVAAAENQSGWSFNMTPVVLLPEDEYRLGGGTDPELKYPLDLGGARLSAGGRVGGYYA